MTDEESHSENLNGHIVLSSGLFNAYIKNFDFYKFVKLSITTNIIFMTVVSMETMCVTG